MKVEDKELIEAYDDFAIAASTLLGCMEHRAGEDADCAEDYPFKEDFYEVSSKIRTWAFTADERLSKETNVEQSMTAAGFRLTNTGGGCTAFEKVLSDNINPANGERMGQSYLLITNADDPSHPEKMTDLVTVGIYYYSEHDGENGAILQHEIPVADALKFCEGVKV
mgnify:FL=1